MKKTYMKPEITQEAIIGQHIMAGSEIGLDSGDSLGDDYNPEDVSYSNMANKLWDED